MLVQKINIKVEDSFNMAYKYFSVLSILNNIPLVKRDIQLLSYAISEEKTISDIKGEFIDKFGTSYATVGNIISKLYKLKILEKENKEVRVNPHILIDFNKNLLLVVSLKHEEDGD